MTRDYFDLHVKPSLSNYVFTYSSFLNGDFGDIERVEFFGQTRLGGIDFWSRGWVGFHVFDKKLDDEVMNILLSPDEMDRMEAVFNQLVNLLLS